MNDKTVWYESSEQQKVILNKELLEGEPEELNILLIQGKAKVEALGELYAFHQFQFGVNYDGEEGQQHSLHQQDFKDEMPDTIKVETIRAPNLIINIARWEEPEETETDIVTWEEQEETDEDIVD